MQDLRVMLPRELRAGPVVMQGRIVHRALDGSWLRFKLRWERGEFDYRVSGGAPSARAIRLQPAPGDAQAVRTLPLDTLRPTAAGSPVLCWEGEVTGIAANGSEIEADIVFWDEVFRLQMTLGENVPAGLDPTPTYRKVPCAVHEA